MIDTMFYLMIIDKYISSNDNKIQNTLCTYFRFDKLLLEIKDKICVLKLT